MFVWDIVESVIPGWITSYRNLTMAYLYIFYMRAIVYSRLETRGVWQSTFSPIYTFVTPYYTYIYTQDY